MTSLDQYDQTSQMKSELNMKGFDPSAYSVSNFDQSEATKSYNNISQYTKKTVSDNRGGKSVIQSKSAQIKHKNALK